MGCHAVSIWRKGLSNVRVGIIGSGISGLASAYYWSKEHDVVVFEKNAKLGGHTDTTDLDDGTKIDTGFIVLNDKTYPTLHALFRAWGVDVRDSDMSFSFYDVQNHDYYAGNNLNGLFAKRSNLVKPSYYAFLYQIYAFGKIALKDLEAGKVHGQSIGAYLKQRDISQEVIARYILPMLASIWSAPSKTLMDHPATSILAFMRNHGLLDLTQRPQWQTVVGGSQTYIDRLCEIASFRTLLHTPVQSVERKDDHVCIQASNETHVFDKVIIATHADQVLFLLKNPTPEETQMFEPWRYESNWVTVHKDTRWMPPVERAWASWNYLSGMKASQGAKLHMTYYANLLQGIESETPYLITLNAKDDIDPANVFFNRCYEHPIYTQDAVDARAKYLRHLPEENNIEFVGSYFGFGFHEDGAKSAYDLAHRYSLA